MDKFPREIQQLITSLLPAAIDLRAAAKAGLSVNPAYYAELRWVELQGQHRQRFQQCLEVIGSLKYICSAGIQHSRDNYYESRMSIAGHNGREFILFGYYMHLFGSGSTFRSMSFVNKMDYSSCSREYDREKRANIEHIIRWRARNVEVPTYNFLALENRLLPKVITRRGLFG